MLLTGRRHTSDTTASSRPPAASFPSINAVSLVGVAHDIQAGYVFEESVLQFTVTTTALQSGVAASRPASGSSAAECVVEKDHHVVRCFGELFSQDVQQRVKEGSIVCVHGRLRLNPQLEPSVNKYYYFPYIQVQPPHGQISVIYSDRANPPQAVEPAPAAVEPREAPAAAATAAPEETTGIPKQ